MKWIEQQLDRYTMYQVVLGALSVWVVATIPLSLLNLIPYSVPELVTIFSTILIVGVATHGICSRIWKAPANFDSTLITILILFFLLTPSMEWFDIRAAAVATVIAIAGKYVIAYRQLHIFNPVALGAFLVGLFGIGFASWWVATPWLFPLVLIGGLAIAMKIRRLEMILAGVATAFLFFAIDAMQAGEFNLSAAEFFLISSPLVFFFTVMVTEPLTTPGKRVERSAYAVLIGALYSIPFSVGPIFNSPETVLLIANALMYPLTLRSRLTLTLRGTKEVAKDTIEFIFLPSIPVTFAAGQYLEWTLPHEKADRRGIRRYFTIASAPSDPEVRVAMKITEGGSTYKETFSRLEIDDIVYATARAGDFVLAQEPQKYLFMAGGIGVTPFVSHVREELASGVAIDAVLLYAVRREEDLAYLDVFREAKTELGLQIIPIVSEPKEGWQGERGWLDEDMLHRLVPDYTERLCYVSGPPSMVGSYAAMLRKHGVKHSSIKTDYFPGLA